MASEFDFLDEFIEADEPEKTPQGKSSLDAFEEQFRTVPAPAAIGTDPLGVARTGTAPTSSTRVRSNTGQPITEEDYLAEREQYIQSLMPELPEDPVVSLNAFKSRFSRQPAVNPVVAPGAGMAMGVQDAYVDSETGKKLTFQELQKYYQIEAQNIISSTSPDILVDWSRDFQDLSIGRQYAQTDDPREGILVLQDMLPEGADMKVFKTGEQAFLPLIRMPGELVYTPLNREGFSRQDIAEVGAAVTDPSVVAPAAIQLSTPALRGVGTLMSNFPKISSAIANFASRIGIVTQPMISTPVGTAGGALYREQRETEEGYQLNTPGEIRVKALTEVTTGMAFEALPWIGRRLYGVSSGRMRLLAPEPDKQLAAEILSKYAGIDDLTLGQNFKIAGLKERQLAQYTEDILRRYQDQSIKLGQYFRERTGRDIYLDPSDYEQIHKSLRNEIISSVRNPETGVYEGGTAAINAVDNFFKGEAQYFSEQYPKVYSMAVGDVVYDLYKGKGLAKKYADLPTRLRGDKVSVVDPETGIETIMREEDLINGRHIGSEVRSSLNKLAKIDPIVRDYRGVSGLQQLHDLRKEFGDILFDRTGNYRNADKEAASEAWGVISEAIENAQGGGELFQKEFAAINNKYRSYINTKRLDFVNRLLGDNTNPAQLVTELVHPDKNIELSFMLGTMDEQNRKVFKDAVKTRILSDPENIDQFLGRFLNSGPTGKETLDLLLSQSEQKSLRDVGKQIRVLNSTTFTKLQEQNLTAASFALELAKSGRREDFTKMLEVGGEPLASSIRMAILDDIVNAGIESAQVVRFGKKGTAEFAQSISPRAIRNRLNDWKKWGAATGQPSVYEQVFSPAVREELEKVAWASQLIPDNPADVGQALQAASTVGPLEMSAVIPSNWGKVSEGLFSVMTKRREAKIWLSPALNRFVTGGSNFNPMTENEVEIFRGLSTYMGLAIGQHISDSHARAISEQNLPEELKQELYQFRDNTALNFLDEYTEEGTEDTRFNFEPLAATSNEVKTTNDPSTELSDWDSIISSERTSSPERMAEWEAEAGVDEPNSEPDTNKFLDIPPPTPKPEIKREEGILPKIQGSIRAKKLVQQVVDASPKFGRVYGKIAALESSMGKQLYNPKSKAWGVLQFVPATWDYHAEKVGLKGVSLKDATPEQYAKVADDFTQMNVNMLTDKLGRAPTDGEIYLYHHFGSGGGATILNNLNSKVKDILPRDYKSNREIIENKTGKELLLYLELSLKRGKFSKNHSLAAQIAAFR